jgi:hypothetical protein
VVFRFPVAAQLLTPILPQTCWRIVKRHSIANFTPVSSFGFQPYIHGMLSRVRNSRGRPLNAPAAETGALHGQKAKGKEN